MGHASRRAAGARHRIPDQAGARPGPVSRVNPTVGSTPVAWYHGRFARYRIGGNEEREDRADDSHGCRGPWPGRPGVPLSPGPAPAGPDAARDRRPRSPDAGRGGGALGRWGPRICRARRSSGRPRGRAGGHRHAARLARRAGRAGARRRPALRGGQGHGADDRGGRPDDRGPRPIGPDAVGLPQPAVGLGFRDRQAGARLRLDRPSPAPGELRLPRRRAAGLARAAPRPPGRSCTTGARTWSTRPSSSASARADGSPPG